MSFKDVIIFMSGVAVGGLAATLFWRERYRQKYKKEADEKVQSMLEYVNHLRERDKDGGLASQARYTAKSDLRDINRNEGTSNEKKNAKGQYTRYSDIYSKMHDAEEKLANEEYPREETGDERIKKETKMKDTSKEKPKIINSVEYDTQYEWFDKATLLYYVGDGVITTEDYAEPVDDIEMLLGNAFEESGFKDNDEDELFVRNFSRGTDYVVVKIYSAWADS